MCQIKFILTGQTPKLTGECLVTGCYYKHCNTLYVCSVIIMLACTLLLMNQDCQLAFNECLTSNVREYQV